MPNDFSVRVEMHGGGDYDLLHAVMHELGFRRYIVGVTSQNIQSMFLLPTGSYVLRDVAETVTALTIRNNVKTIADEIEKGKDSPYVWVVKFIHWSISSKAITEDPDEHPSQLMQSRVKAIRQAAGV